MLLFFSQTRGFSASFLDFIYIAKVNWNPHVGTVTFFFQLRVAVRKLFQINGRTVFCCS